MRHTVFASFLPQAVVLFVIALLAACGNGPAGSSLATAEAAGTNADTRPLVPTASRNGRPPATPADAIEGVFLADDNGSTLMFSHGKFISAYRPRNGTYSVEGAHIVLARTDGTRFDGERIDADHLRFRMRDDTPVFDVDLYRQGTAAADAILKRLGLPTAAKPPTAGAAPPPSADARPDPSVPLSSYKPLADGHDIGILVAAWSNPPLPEEFLLKELVDGYAEESDSFKKHDRAVQARTPLQQAIAADRGVRAWKLPLGVMFPSAVVEHYDWTTHTFPLLMTLQPRSTEHDCWAHWAVGSGRLEMVIATTNLPCALPVADEEMARKIEAARGRFELHIDGTLSLWVIGPPAPGGSLPTVLMHAHVVVTARDDPSVRWEQDL